MKLTREDLFHAREYQLAAIGITRAKNKGWMRSALNRHFSPAEIESFRSAKRPSKESGHGRPFCGKKRLRTASVGTLDMFERAVFASTQIESKSPQSTEQSDESARAFANALYERCNRDVE
jgi:hypothetical protein